MTTMSSRLGQILKELKAQDPLQGIPPSCRMAVVTLRFLSNMLWLYRQPTELFPILSEEEALGCLKVALGWVAYSWAVLCLAYHIDSGTLHIQEKWPNQKKASERDQRLHQLLEQLCKQCWAHSVLFEQRNLEKSQDLRQHEASIQLGCTWFILLELANWCDADLIDLLLAYGKSADMVSSSDLEGGKGAVFQGKTPGAPGARI